MIREEPEFFNKFLESYGFKQYKCRVCGERFWSITSKSDCRDRPCSKYDFLVKEYPSVKKLTLDNARRKFIEFFKRNGHGYVDPYPVLARWRNDLYLTIASIVVFQPAVTEGIVDPPYNPLVIVQPCIRLEDIDEVGYTFGRHLSSFEMGGHHAFNKPDSRVYWVDETLEYAFKFFTEEIGIPEEDIVFKDSWWEGGGNAGPAYEVIVDGLELATLVFMKYRVVNGEYKPMDILVVDTGYGIERIAWFTQKTPTAFHAIYGELLGVYKQILEVEEPPYNVLKDIVYRLSNIDFSSIDEFREIIVKQGYSEYYRQLLDSINTYMLLDHSRTLALMLSDGIVPSNTGEGYLARLVLRRMLRTLYRLGIETERYRDVMLQLIASTINYWRDKYVYSRFIESRDYIMDVIDYEVRKYIDTLNRGLRIVEKTIKKKKTINIDELIKIYDSYGIQPEIVVDKAREFGVKASLPRNFYSLVAKRHAQPDKLVKYREEELPRYIREWASGFSETRRLFHEDPYLRRFRARVLGVKQNYLVLDRTAFYPVAGGQDCDKGYIVLGDGGKVAVSRVYKCGEVIVHELSDSIEGLIKRDDMVEGIIDWSRRYSLMRHHTATHIVLGATRKVLGDHVWQAGVKKTVDKAHLDITHYKLPSVEEIKKIEELANRVIDERREVRIQYLDKFEAERRYGTRIYQGGAIVSKKLRIVEIPGWDVEACFGTHLLNTGEVGCIKITGVEKIQDGIIRLTYVAGPCVASYASSLESIIDGVGDIVGVSGKEVVKAVEKMAKQLSEYKSILGKYRSLYKEALLSKVLSSSIELCGVKYIYLYNDVGDERLYRDLIRDLVSKDSIVVYNNGRIIEIATNKKIVSKGIDLREVLKKLMEKYSDVKGGGKSDHITFRTSIDSREIYRVVRDIIVEMLGCVNN